MSIILENLTKRYEGRPVVNHISLEVAQGELFVLIGPSGSGKSTVLRLIAGLNTADEGRLLLDGRDMTHTSPQARGVGFVFQHYALFKHMSVAENIEFALRVRRAPARERQRRRDELLELVGLAGLGGRRPSQLSGGQQQRVALARALAHQPAVLLLDEPFGALDAKIRVELRRALRRVQTELGLTTLFVTHDQEEAFELGDRLGVMNFGRLLEVGRPVDLYQRPQTEFVATFLGAGNLLVGQREPDGARLGPVYFPLPQESGPRAVERAQILFRPEDVALAAEAEQLGCPALGRGLVEQNAMIGPVERLRLQLPTLPGVRPIAPGVAFGSEAMLIEASRPPEAAAQLPLTPGQAVWVGVRRVHALAHPGLSFLIPTDGAGGAHLELGGQLARLAHARVTLMGYGAPAEALRAPLQAIKEKFGSGLAAVEVQSYRSPLAFAVAAESERQPYDLALIHFHPPEGLAQAEAVLQAGEHHLLLVPPQAAALTPRRVLICVTIGEPGKEDVLFAGRLVRHLGAEATLLSVISPTDADPERQTRAERFLADGVRTLEALSVPAQTLIRSGPPRTEILAEMQTGRHDLLVMGAPLANRSGAIVLEGVARQILQASINHPTLIIRSQHAAQPSIPLTADGRVNIVEE